MTVVTINPGEFPDDAAAINAALADPDVSEVILGAGVFVLHSPIFVPSFKILRGQGDDTILRANADFTRAPGEYDGLVNSLKTNENPSSTGIQLYDFVVDVNKLSPGGARMSGVFMHQSTDFVIKGVDVYNATGYAHFVQGVLGGAGVTASGTYEDCYTYNSQVHFEQMAANGVTLIDCHAFVGEGDVPTEAFFHPVLGSKNITYINVTGYGAAFSGFNMISGGNYGPSAGDLAGQPNPLENITIINADIEITRASSAITATSFLPIVGLTIVDSRFVSHGQTAVRLGGTVGTIENSHFHGEGIGIQFLGAGDGSTTDMVVTDSHTVGMRDPAGSAGAFGIASSGGSVVWNGGSIEGRGKIMVPLGSSNITLGPGTQLITTGFGARLNYVENGAPTAIAPTLALSSAGLGSLDGGTFEATLLKGTAADRLDIAEVGGITVSGGEVSFEGVVIGTVMGGLNGAPLLVTLGPGATPEAVEALMRAVTYENLSDNPVIASRYVEFVLADADGEEAEANAVVTMTAVNDQPAVDLSGDASPLVADYAENAAPVLLAPAATVTDPDSLDLAGGSLTVSVTVNGSADDRLTIVEGGLIALAGTDVTYAGTAIGTISGGEGAPLVVALNSNATLAAAETLLRAVAYSSTSDDPPESVTVSLALNDGDGGAVPLSVMTVVIAASDDAPAAQDDEAEIGEDSAADLDLLANDDVDAGPGSPVVEIEGTALAPGDSLLLPSGARMTLNSDGTVGYDPNGAFEALAEGATAVDAFTYSLANGTSAVATVTVTGVNDAPALDLAAAAPVYEENGAAVALAPAALLTDVDLADLDGGALTVEIAGAGATDLLAILATPDIGLDGNSVLYQGSAIATVSGGSDGEPLVFAFGPAAGVAGVEALIRAVGYSSGSEAPSGEPRQVTFTIDDGAGGSAVAAANLSILPVDDAPVAVADLAATDEATPVDIDVLSNEFDVDAGPGPQIAAVDGAALAPGDSLALASGAIVTLNPDGTIGYDPNGVFDFLPAGATGGDSFVYTLATGTNATVRVTVAGLASAGDAIAGTPAGETIAGTPGQDLFLAQQGGDDLVLGDAGDDVVYFGSAFTSADQVDGGDGFDRLLIQGSYNSVLGPGTLNNIEALVLLSSTFELYGGADPGASFGYTLRFADMAIAAGSILVIDGSGLAADEILSLDGTFESDGRFEVLGGAANDTLRTGTGEDLLKGGAGNDLLDGGGGADRLEGGAGDDDYIVGEAGDVVVELPGEGTDSVFSALSYVLGDHLENLVLTGAAVSGTGNALANRITGNAAANVLDGAAGADRMAGGGGDDSYLVDNAGDEVVESAGEGFDTVRSSVGYALPDEVEVLILTGNAAIDATGNGAGNFLYGNSAANRLDGGAGADLMYGGDGDDTYVVDHSGDRANETAGAGTDTVFASVSFTLGAHVERLVLTGTANISGVGNELDNHLTGNSGHNTLSGGAGNDTMTGGLGNDTYWVEEPGDVVVELPSQGTDTVRVSFDYTLAANFENLILVGAAVSGTGNSANNVITGNALANLLTGGAGHDTLDGGAGADVLIGGTGNDIYVVDQLGDSVVELAGEGTDTVQSFVSWTLGDHLEILTLVGSAAIDGTANALANVINGNAAANVLDGGAGADSMFGGLGDDTYIVSDLGDRATETSTVGGYDTVLSAISFVLAPNVEKLVLTGTGHTTGVGNAGVNLLVGNSGNNTLSGAAGADTMEGGLGNDTYWVDDPGDVVVELAGEGTDTVLSWIDYTLGDQLENLTLSGTAALSGMGNALNNVITGNGAANALAGGEGDDTLNGGAGADTLTGGTGNDIYVVDQVGDTTVEQAGEGTDTVQSFISWTLGEELEILTLVGTAAIDGTGNALNNVINGNGAANILDGGSGADNMFGGLGDDTYIVDHSGDRATETSAAGGTDTVLSSVTFTLGAHVENLTLTGAGDIDAIGNDLANVLIGNSGANRLVGGLGADRLEGGAGADTYVYRSVDESTGSTLDTIFSFEAGDRIDLTQIDAVSGTAGNDAFTFIGSSAFSGTAGELRAYEQDGAWIVEGDVDGDGFADLAISVATADGYALTGTDFLF